MKRYGLIGKNLSHSFSPDYFRKKFREENIGDASYTLFETEKLDAEFIAALAEADVKGFNVTIPYKESIIPFLDDVDKTASELGAVNTVKLRSGRLSGFNTDVYGFEQSLLEYKGHIEKGKALILGTGGASKAVAYVLGKWGISYQFVSRQEQYLQYDQLNCGILSECSLVVNTTPLGMYPETDDFPMIPYGCLSAQHLVYDLIYNPQKTVFLEKAAQNDAFILNGYNMLVFQAEKAWEIWNNDAK